LSPRRTEKAIITEKTTKKTIFTEEVVENTIDGAQNITEIVYSLFKDITDVTEDIFNIDEEFIDGGTERTDKVVKKTLYGTENISKTERVAELNEESLQAGDKRVDDFENVSEEEIDNVTDLIDDEVDVTNDLIQQRADGEEDTVDDIFEQVVEGSFNESEGTLVLSFTTFDGSSTRYFRHRDASDAFTEETTKKTTEVQTARDGTIYVGVGTEAKTTEETTENVVDGAEQTTNGTTEKTIYDINDVIDDIINGSENATEEIIDGANKTREVSSDVKTEKTLNDVVEDDSNASEDAINELQDNTDEAETDSEYVVDNTKSIRDETIEKAKSRGGDVEDGVVSNKGVDEHGEITTENQIDTDIGVDDDVVDELSTSTDLYGDGQTKTQVQTRGIDDQVTTDQRQVSEEIVSDTGNDFKGWTKVETDAKTERSVPDDVIQDLRSDYAQKYLNGGTDVTEKVMKDIVDDLYVKDVDDGVQKTTNQYTNTQVFSDLQQTNVGQDVVVDQNVNYVVDVGYIDTDTVNAVQLQVGQDNVGGIVQELNTVDEAKTDLSEN